MVYVKHAELTRQRERRGVNKPRRVTVIGRPRTGQKHDEPLVGHFLTSLPVHDYKIGGGL
jgi:hypothetical protein